MGTHYGLPLFLFKEKGCMVIIIFLKEKKKGKRKEDQTKTSTNFPWVRAVRHAHSHTRSREEKGNEERALVTSGAAVAAPLVSFPSLSSTLSPPLVSWETVTATRARNPTTTASGRTWFRCLFFRFFFAFVVVCVLFCFVVIGLRIWS